MKKLWLFLLCISWGTFSHAETVVLLDRYTDQPVENVRRQPFAFSVQKFLDKWKKQGFSMHVSNLHDDFDDSHVKLIINHKNQDGNAIILKFVFSNKQQVAEIIPIVHRQELWDEMFTVTESDGIMLFKASEESKQLAISVIAHAFKVSDKQAEKMYDMLEQQLCEKVAHKEYEVYPDNFYSRLSRNGLFVEFTKWIPPKFTAMEPTESTTREPHDLYIIRIYKTDDVPEKSYRRCNPYPCQ